MSPTKNVCAACARRREFLRLGAEAAVALAVLGPAMTALSSCGQTPLSSGGPQLGTIVVGNSPSNVYIFSFADHPQLANIGGSIHATIAATSGPKDVYITRVSSGSIRTVSTVCTHQGCTLDSYDPGAQLYHCPCHGSAFNAGGNVVNGPATLPLPTYESTISGNQVDVTIP